MRTLTLILLLSLAIVRQAEVVQAQEFDFSNVNLGLSYYECTDPPPPCVSLSLNDRDADCPNCGNWEERRRDVSLSLDPNAYDYSRGIGLPRMNYFIRDVAERGFNTSFPRTFAGVPITTSELFENADELGWLEVGDELSREGSFAVWPGGGGLVVSDIAGTVRLLYPSDARNGRLRVLELGALRDGDVRFLVPPFPPSSEF